MWKRLYTGIIQKTHIQLYLNYFLPYTPSSGHKTILSTQNKENHNSVCLHRWNIEERQKKKTSICVMSFLHSTICPSWKALSLLIHQLNQYQLTNTVDSPFHINHFPSLLQQFQVKTSLAVPV